MASNLFLLWVALSAILMRAAALSTSTVTDMLLMCGSETIPGTFRSIVSGCSALYAVTNPQPQRTIITLRRSTYLMTLFWTLTTPLSTLSSSIRYTSGMRFFQTDHILNCGTGPFGYRCATDSTVFHVPDLYKTYYIPSGLTTSTVTSTLTVSVTRPVTVSVTQSITESVTKSFTETVTKSVCKGEDGTLTIHTMGPVAGWETSVECLSSS